jgi:hypothetical protein
MAGFDLDELTECLDQILPLVAHARDIADRLAKTGDAKGACSTLVEMVGIFRGAADTLETDAARLANAAVAAGEDRAEFAFVLD